MTATKVAAGTQGAATARSAELTLRAQLLREVARLWPLLDVKRLDETWPGWLRAMQDLTSRYHLRSAQGALTSYQHMRSLAGYEPLGHPAQLPALDPKWAAKAYGYSGPGLKLRASDSTAQSTTMGTAARLVADGGRQMTVGLILGDPVALGWYRETDADPCGFCALLASRGAVYKRNSFKASDAQFLSDPAKPSTIKVHNLCACQSRPLFTKDAELPDTANRADDLYVAHVSKLPNAQRMAAFRKVWALRNDPQALAAFDADWAAAH